VSGRNVCTSYTQKKRGGGGLLYPTNVQKGKEGGAISIANHKLFKRGEVLFLYAPPSGKRRKRGVSSSFSNRRSERARYQSQFFTVGKKTARRSTLSQPGSQYKDEKLPPVYSCGRWSVVIEHDIEKRQGKKKGSVALQPLGWEGPFSNGGSKKNTPAIPPNTPRVREKGDTHHRGGSSREEPRKEGQHERVHHLHRHEEKPSRSSPTTAPNTKTKKGEKRDNELPGEEKGKGH